LAQAFSFQGLKPDLLMRATLALSVALAFASRQEEEVATTLRLEASSWCSLGLRNGALCCHGGCSVCGGAACSGFCCGHYLHNLGKVCADGNDVTCLLSAEAMASPALPAEAVASPVAGAASDPIGASDQYGRTWCMYGRRSESLCCKRHCPTCGGPYCIGGDCCGGYLARQGRWCENAWDDTCLIPGLEKRTDQAKLTDREGIPWCARGRRRGDLCCEDACNGCDDTHCSGFCCGSLIRKLGKVCVDGADVRCVVPATLAELQLRFSQRESNAFARWVVFLRIQRTGSTFLASSLRGSSCSCRYAECQCQHGAVESYHGKPCADMDCISYCAARGCQSMVDDAPHADWKDLNMAFARAGVRRNDIDLITMLREPVARVLSEFSWVSRHIHSTCSTPGGHIYAWDYNLPCNLTLESFAKHQEAHEHAHDRQTKMVAGTGMFSWREVYDSEEHMLETAKRHLRDMAWLGILERLNESLALLSCTSVGSRMTIQPSTFRRSVRKGRISHDARLLIARSNRLDAELYRYGLSIFDARLLSARSHGCAAVNALTTDAVLAPGLIPPLPLGPSVPPAAATQASVTPLARYVSLAESLGEPAVRFGEMLDSEFISARPECNFSQDEHNHLGTYTWYNSQFGCAFQWDWYRTAVYALQEGLAPGTFEVRTFLARWPKLLKGQYVLAIGAAQTMGVQSQHPYGLYLEEMLDMPVVAIGWGGAGAAFFVDLLRTQANATAVGAALKTLVRHARVVIVQSLSGRSESFQECKSMCNNMYCHTGEPAEAILQQLDHARRARALRDIEKSWVKHHTVLLHLAGAIREQEQPRLVVFLHQSSQSFPSKDDSVFPQYVTSRMIGQVKRQSAAGVLYVEATLPSKIDTVIVLTDRLCHPGCLQPGKDVCRMDRLGNCACGGLLVDYYPTPHLQSKIAQRLYAAIGVRLQLGGPQERLDGTRPLVAHAPGGIGRDAGASSVTELLALSEGSSRIFLLQTRGHVSFSERAPGTLLESACKHHPEMPVIIFYLSNATVDRLYLETLRGLGCSVAAHKVLDERALFRGTPLQGWLEHRLDEFRRGEYWFSHLTDIFRLTALWTYGGWYMDTDTVILRPIMHLRNVFGLQDTEDRINNAVCHFERRHPFLEHAMRYLINHYRPENRTSAGPDVATEAYFSWHSKHGCGHPGCITLLGKQAFSPVHFLEAQAFVGEVITEAGYMNVTREALILHYYNYLSVDVALRVGGGLHKAYRANCLLCHLGGG